MTLINITGADIEVRHDKRNIAMHLDEWTVIYGRPKALAKFRDQIDAALADWRSISFSGAPESREAKARGLRLV